MKLIRIVGFPFALLYGLVLRLRHFLYDQGWLKEHQFNRPVICVGNLSFGGTGKTPFTIYLAKLLGDQPELAVLSRGYKRKTQGFLKANTNSSVEDLGDEPLLIYQNLQKTTVAVDENRARGLQQLFDEHHAQIAILDDALQHRKVKANLNILLTDYNHRYTKDWLVPAGKLRDIKHRAKDAQMIVVTKCPEDVDFKKITEEINPMPAQHVYFTKLQYTTVRPLLGDQLFDLDFLSHKGLVVFTGIANPQYLESFMRSKSDLVHFISFPDHHHYQPKDIQRVTEIFDNFAANSKMVVTTEKDAVKLSDPALAPLLLKLPVFVLRVEIAFMRDQEIFERQLNEYARTN